MEVVNHIEIRDNQAELDAEYERTVTAYRDQALTLDDFRTKHEK